MPSAALPAGLHLESLAVGAGPLIRHFLDRLDLPGLFEQHLPKRLGWEPALSSPTVLCLSAVQLAAGPATPVCPAWLAGLPAASANPLACCLGRLLNDDRLGRALDHLHHAHRASLL